MKQLWNRKGKRLLATLLAVLLVWNLCPQMGFAVSAAASAVSGNEATPSDAKEATENTELDEDESDEFADGDLENDLASPSDAEKDDTYITGNDEEVDAVQDMIASLPSIKEYNQLTAEEQAEVLAQVQEAMDAYNDLTAEQQKGIVGEEIFTLYEEFLTATPSNAVKAAAFEQSQTIDGITIRVTADKGVFPEDAKLHVELVEDTQLQEQIQTAVEETTGAKDDPKKTVEKTMAFDITILDGEGNELQPDTEQGQVKVSFEKVDTANVEAGKSTLEVFHLNEDNTQAEKLDAEVDVNAKTVEVQAEHFSVYALGEVATQADGNVASVTVGETTTPYATINEAWNAATAVEGASTITLLKNCETSKDMLLVYDNQYKADITLELNEYELAISGNANIYLSYGKLTVKGGANGKITGSYNMGTIQANNTNAKLEIQGGTITSSTGYAVYFKGYNLTISGGTFTGAGGDNGYGLYIVSGTRTLSGGTYSSIGVGGGAKAVDALEDGYCYYAGTDATTGSVVSGNTQIINELVTVGKKYYARVTAADGNLIDNYDTLADALTEAQKNSGCKVTLLDNVETNTTTQVTTGKFTLDFDGHTWSFGRTNNADIALRVGGADVTLTDATGTGGITYSATSLIICLLYVDDASGNSKLTINGGKYNSGTYSSTIVVDGLTQPGQLTIDGGTFICGKIESNAVLNVSYFTEGTIAIKGGTFKRYDNGKGLLFTIQTYTNGWTDVNCPVSDLLADGYAFKDNGTWVAGTAVTPLSGTSVTVELAPMKITTQPSAASTLDFGSTVTLTVETNLTEGVTYQWADNGTDITDATTASYTTDKNMAAGAHSFTCKVSMGDYTVTSDAVSISYNYAEPTQDGGVYQIASASNLMWFAATVNGTDGFTQNQSANAVLTADIDMTGITWPGMTSYAGTFDGAGFTIQNLNKGGSGEHQNAFIRTLETNGIVKCLKFDGATAWLHADGRSNAIIAETNNGTIQNCLVLNSSVSCGNYGNLAGIAAVNNNKIENCGVVNTSLNRVYSGASNRNTGGITEVNSGTVTNCFTYICSFTGGVTLGGIVASGTAPTNSYYYTTSNVTSTVDGTAKTTDEFASGEVTWLLNGSYDGETFMPGATDGTQVWYQLLGESGDTYPVLVKADGNTVYKLADGTYSNSNVVATADKIIGHSLTPNGTISVNFYMEFTAETIKNQSQYYVQVKDAKGTVHETTELSDLLRNQTPKIVTDTAGAHSCYKISGAVAAKEMADKLTVKLMKRNGEQETEIFKEDYAVSDYFALAKQSGKTELIALTNAMAIYGAYSQQYFQYNTDTLATDLSGVDVSGVTAEALKDYTYNLVQTENAPISYYGTSLLLEADTTLRHYFKLSEGTASLEGLIFKIGDTVASPVQSTKDTSLYYVEIENIRAKDLELSYTVVVGTADTNYITVTNYSPLTYVKKALESSNTKAGLQPAMQALYLYWKEADKYNYPN